MGPRAAYEEAMARARTPARAVAGLAGPRPQRAAALGDGRRLLEDGRGAGRPRQAARRSGGDSRAARRGRGGPQPLRAELLALRRPFGCAARSPQRGVCRGARRAGRGPRRGAVTFAAGLEVVDRARSALTRRPESRVRSRSPLARLATRTRPRRSSPWPNAPSPSSERHPAEVRRLAAGGRWAARRAERP